jgi:Chlorite dismutase
MRRQHIIDRISVSTSTSQAAASARHFAFTGGDNGIWRVTRAETRVGETLAPAPRLGIAPADLQAVDAAPHWVLRGVTSNDRYVERAEKAALQAVQAGLGRPTARCAALIPIRKTAAWWAMTQDERREIFQARSQHIDIGLRALPAVARRLYHCRDLPGPQPFDFLTWFEFAPEHVGTFDDMLRALRASPEWHHVEREVDIRLVQDGD